MELWGGVFSYERGTPVVVVVYPKLGHMQAPDGRNTRAGVAAEEVVKESGPRGDGRGGRHRERDRVGRGTNPPKVSNVYQNPASSLREWLIRSTNVNIYVESSGRRILLSPPA